MLIVRIHYCVSSDRIRSVFGRSGPRRAVRARRRASRASGRTPFGHRGALVVRRPIAPVTGGPRHRARRRPSSGRRPSRSVRASGGRAPGGRASGPHRRPLLTALDRTSRRRPSNGVQTVVRCH